MQSVTLLIFFALTIVVIFARSTESKSSAHEHPETPDVSLHGTAAVHGEHETAAGDEESEENEESEEIALGGDGDKDESDEEEETKEADEDHRPPQLKHHPDNERGSEDDGNEEHEERQEHAAEEHENHDEQEVKKSGHNGEHKPHWSYHGAHGPSNWWRLNKQCDGERQSPINVHPKTTKLDEMLTEISLVSNHAHGDTVTMVNNGHTVNFAYNRTTIRLSDSGFDHTYKVLGVHFHWGNDDQRGSEHTIDGHHFPLEMHIVSYDEDNHHSVFEALGSRDGLAVLGVLFEISETDNEHLEPIISSLEDIQVPGQPTLVDYFKLSTLLPENRQDYYRYRGSLTTPPCSESVVWTVFASPQKISSAQLEKFRSLYEVFDYKDESGKRLTHNWRPVKPTGKRIVYRSFSSPSLDGARDTQADDKPTSHDDRKHYRTNGSAPVAWGQFQIFVIVSLLLHKLF